MIKFNTAEQRYHLFYSTHPSSFPKPGAYVTHHATWPLSDITERPFIKNRLHAASSWATKDFYTTFVFFYTSSLQVQKLVALPFKFRHEGDITTLHLWDKVTNHWRFVWHWTLLGESTVTGWAHPIFPSDRLIDELICFQSAVVAAASKFACYFFK